MKLSTFRRRLVWRQWLRRLPALAVRQPEDSSAASRAPERGSDRGAKPGELAAATGSGVANAAEPSAPAPVAAARSTGKLAILLAAANRTNQKVISKILQRAGHELTVTDSLELAVRAASGSSPDLVVVDLELGATEPLAVIRRIRAALAGREGIGLVALAAELPESLRREAIEAGVDSLLDKPISPGRLLQAINASRRHAEALPALAAISGERRTAQQPAPVLDQHTLASLEKLGGRPFVAELAKQFIDDTASMLKQLAVIVNAGDLQAFLEQIHALRSAAANVGAVRIYELCLSWRDLDAGTLAVAGHQQLESLREEFERARAELLAYSAQ